MKMFFQKIALRPIAILNNRRGSVATWMVTLVIAMIVGVQTSRMLESQFRMSKKVQIAAELNALRISLAAQVSCENSFATTPPACSTQQGGYIALMDRQSPPQPLINLYVPQETTNSLPTTTPGMLSSAGFLRGSAFPQLNGRTVNPRVVTGGTETRPPETRLGEFSLRAFCSASEGLQIQYLRTASVGGAEIPDPSSRVTLGWKSLYNGVPSPCSHMLGKSYAVSVCPSGQYAVGFRPVDGTPVCQSLNNNPSGGCAEGEIFNGYDSAGRPNCQPEADKCSKSACSKSATDCNVFAAAPSSSPSPSSTPVASSTRLGSASEVLQLCQAGVYGTSLDLACNSFGADCSKWEESPSSSSNLRISLKETMTLLPGINQKVLQHICSSYSSINCSTPRRDPSVASAGISVGAFADISVASGVKSEKCIIDNCGKGAFNCSVWTSSDRSRGGLRDAISLCNGVN